MGGGLGTGAREINDEVRLPCFAEVLGECLLKVIRVWRYIGEELSNENIFSVQCLLIVELAATFFERAEGRWIREHPFLRVRPVKAPLMRLRVVEPQRQALETTGGRVHCELFEVCATTPDLAGRYRSGPLDPFS